jgi:hypothetical protein
LDGSGYQGGRRGGATSLIFSENDMQKTLLAGFLTGLFLVCAGCSKTEKPIDQAQLEKEFNDLQKNRQKEDPNAGKRKY